MVARNRFELEQWGKTAAKAYLDGGVSLNTTIAKIASRERFTDEQVDRVVHMANSYTNGMLVKEAKAKKEDPRISFDMASADDVKSSLGGQAKTAAAVEQAYALDQLFTPPDRSAPRVKLAADGAMEDAFPMEKVADPQEGNRRAIPEGLGRAFLFEREAAVGVAKVANISQIQDAISELEQVKHQARMDAATMVNRVEAGFDKMSALVDRELLGKAHPIHLKEWAKHAKLSDEVQSALLEMIDDRVEFLQLSFPKEAAPLPEVFLVNRDHPLIEASTSVEKVASERGAQGSVISEVEDAIKAAKTCLREALVGDSSAA